MNAKPYTTNRAYFFPARNRFSAQAKANGLSTESTQWRGGYRIAKREHELLFWPAFEVAVTTVGQFCCYYYADPAGGAPRRIAAREIRSRGLSHRVSARKKELREIGEWLRSVVRTRECFTLVMDDEDTIKAHQKPIVKGERPRPLIFSHPDDTCCWTLSLTDDQYDALRVALREHGLPEDLFVERQL